MAEETKKEVSPGKTQEIQKVAPARALSPFEEMDRLFEGFFPRGWLRPMRWEWPELPTPFEGRMPRVDVVDREAEIVVRAEVPGAEKKDLDVSVTENTVTIKGSSRREEKEEKDNYYRREIVRGAFSRTVALPSDVDSSKAKATFKEGVLELSIPKVEKAKRRSIAIE
jgi:HSP20 family protein